MTNRGPWRYRSGSHPPTAAAAAAAVPHQLQQLSRCICHTAAFQPLLSCRWPDHCHQPPALCTSSLRTTTAAAAAVMPQGSQWPSCCRCHTVATRLLLVRHRCISCPVGVSCSSLQPTSAHCPTHWLRGCCTNTHRAAPQLSYCGDYAGTTAASSVQLSCSNNSSAAFVLHALAAVPLQHVGCCLLR